MHNKKNKNQQPLFNISKVIHEPARLLIMAQLFVVESIDYIFLLHRTKMTQGNLSTHLKKLEESGYIAVKKEFVGKKPHTLLSLTNTGRKKFEQYVSNMKQIFDNLNDAIVTQSNSDRSH